MADGGASGNRMVEDAMSLKKFFQLLVFVYNGVLLLQGAVEGHLGTD